MGWSNRGNGHTFDSMNGYCCIIGVQCGKVMAYKTFNRQCKACNEGFKTGFVKEHPCRKNFDGSAKSMEGQGAKDVATAQTLKNARIEIGGFVGDNDSQSIDAAQSVVAHSVLKQSDMLHTKRNIKKHLYTIKGSKTTDPDSELNHDSIKHILKCFSYAVGQYIGKLEDMRLAIKNIPFHFMGKHKGYCGNWCKAEKENYDASVRLKNPVLQGQITKLFDDLSKEADKFLSGASSQANESLFNTMAHKAPKRTNYSSSGSADFRFAACVAQKNCHETYILKVLDELKFSYTQSLSDYLEKKKVKAIKRHAKALEPESKKKRVERCEKRSQLKYRNEKSEGVLYESGISLFENTKTAECITECQEFTLFSKNPAAIVFYDIETGGFDLLRHEIIQICLKFEDKVFSTYLTPTKPIDRKASEVHHLTRLGKKLFKNGIEVPTMSKRLAMTKLIEFLKGIGQKCLLVAHNDRFDAPRLVHLLQELELAEGFQELIYGFSDSLPLFRKAFPDLDCHKLEFMAKKKLSVSCDQAHDAAFDVEVLEKLSAEFLYVEDFVNILKTYNEVEQGLHAKDVKKSFAPLTGTISDGMITRLAQNGISYDSIVEAFLDKGEEGASELLMRPKNGKATIIKKKSILETIICHLRNLSRVVENGMTVDPAEEQDISLNDEEGYQIHGL